MLRTHIVSADRPQLPAHLRRKDNQSGCFSKVTAGFLERGRGGGNSATKRSFDVALDGCGKYIHLERKDTTKFFSAIFSRQTLRVQTDQDFDQLRAPSNEGNKNIRVSKKTVRKKNTHTPLILVLNLGVERCALCE